jgi:enamine deaminase RidA (YjgF/YER057c/UK114 family)
MRGRFTDDPRKKGVARLPKDVKIEIEAIAVRR